MTRPNTWLTLKKYFSATGLVILAGLPFSQVNAQIVNPTGNLLAKQNNTGVSVSASFSDSRRPVSNIHDQSSRSYWSNNSSKFPMNDKVVADLDRTVAVERIVLNSPSIIDFDLEYFDGKDWQVANSFRVTPSNKEFFVGNIAAQKWRIRNFLNASTGNATSVTINEWELYGSDGDDLAKINDVETETVKELASASVDECFRGVYNPLNAYPYSGPCILGQQKINESYVWGMTHYKSGSSESLYLGIGANVWCLALDKYVGLLIPYIRIGGVVCENSLVPREIPADWRPPNMYRYDLKTNRLTKLSLNSRANSIRNKTVGFRSAGNHQGIVFLGGPTWYKTTALMAFNAETGQLLGSTVVDMGYSNVRKMIVVNGDLYLGVGNGGGDPDEEYVNENVDEKANTGAVIRWTGNAAAILAGDTSSLFDFEVVGTQLDGEAAEIGTFENRMMVSSWPNLYSTRGGGLWRSPSLPINTALANEKTIWQTNTSNGNRLVFDENGNLVLYASDGSKVFESNTGGKGATELLFQNNGKLAIYNSRNNLLWSSDAEWKPQDIALNNFALESAIRAPRGSTLYAGQSLRSRSGHFGLELTSSGNLQITERVLPWARVWGADQYDPEPDVAKTYGIGVTAELDGWLHWGTMHVPASSVGRYEIINGTPDDTDVRYNMLYGFHRSISLFRGRNLGTPQQEIELLYGGSSFYPDAPQGHYPVHLAYQDGRGNIRNQGQFEFRMNLMNQIPKYGRGGLGNPWANYTWSLANYNNDIYIGTMDVSEGIKGIWESWLGRNILLDSADANTTSEYGYELYKMDTLDTKPELLTSDGFDNFTAYGIRTMISTEDGLYLGTANGSNVHPKSGWQLLRVTADKLDAKVDQESGQPQGPQEDASESSGDDDSSSGGGIFSWLFPWL